jgi:hypothetical protein
MTHPVSVTTRGLSHLAFWWCSELNRRDYYSARTISHAAVASSRACERFVGVRAEALSPRPGR